MNFLAHLVIAGNDEGLRLGAMLGDFVRGQVKNSGIFGLARRGILLHRHVDQYIDSLPEVLHLREQFQPPFRRYSGIIVDLALDHQLALRWNEFSAITLEQFDIDVRKVLARHKDDLPEELLGFMRYADRRGLFATYREETEILFSLQGLGRRLSRPNPLHRVADIWMEVKPALSEGFSTIFPLVQNEASNWLQQHPAAKAKS